GYRAALMATMLGFPVSWYFFVPIQGSFWVSSPVYGTGFAMYFMVSFTIVLFAQAAQNARRDADEHAEYLTITLKSIGDGVIVTDSNLEIIETNPVAEIMTGYSSAQMLGQPLHTILSIVDERTRVLLPLPAIEAIETGRIISAPQDAS